MARWLRKLSQLLLLSGSGVLLTSLARAELIQAPVAGKAFELGDDRVACAVSDGWSIEGNGRLLRPPNNAEAQGRVTELRWARSSADCERAPNTSQLVATGAWPLLDAASIVLSVDEARLEARGKRLRGAQVAWKGAISAGADSCNDPLIDGQGERCSWLVGRDLSADPSSGALRLLPPGAKPDPNAVLIDADGRRVAASSITLAPSKVIVNQLVAPDTSLDLATGRGEIRLLHPEAVGGADCSGVECSTSSGKLTASSTSTITAAAEVRLRLLPHVVFQRGTTQETQPLFRVPIVRCSMTVASGSILRVERARVVLRMDQRCAQDLASYRFLIGNTPLSVVQTASHDGNALVVLELGSRAEDSVVIVAERSSGGLIAAARVAVNALPTVKARLEIAGYPRIDFIPTNRSALVHVPRIDSDLYLDLQSLDGVYLARRTAKQMFVQGDPSADGLVSLRFALRSRALPAALKDVDLGVVQDALQRPILQANVPISIGATMHGKTPLFEFLCGSGAQLVRINPGEPVNVPFELRDTCRIVFHRERLGEEHGDQKLSVAVDVFNTEGGTRSDAQVRETLFLQAAPQPRLLWVRGIVNPFDRVVVRISHDPDPTHYVKGSRSGSSNAALQWSAIIGTGRLRLYATSAIPTGLYRFGGKHNSGSLSLNFGVISRLTVLTDDGHEWPIGLEGGVMVLGLAGSSSATGENLRQVGAVTGLGLSVPIANRNSMAQASINLHGWIEFPFGNEKRLPPAFIFGPSISFGSIGSTL